MRDDAVAIVPDGEDALHARPRHDHVVRGVTLHSGSMEPGRAARPDRPGPGAPKERGAGAGRAVGPPPGPEAQAAAAEVVHLEESRVEVAHPSHQEQPVATLEGRQAVAESRGFVEGQGHAARPAGAQVQAAEGPGAFVAVEVVADARAPA